MSSLFNEPLCARQLAGQHRANSSSFHCRFLASSFLAQLRFSVIIFSSPNFPAEDRSCSASIARSAPAQASSHAATLCEPLAQNGLLLASAVHTCLHIVRFHNSLLQIRKEKEKERKICLVASYFLTASSSLCSILFACLFDVLMCPIVCVCRWDAVVDALSQLGADEEAHAVRKQSERDREKELREGPAVPSASPAVPPSASDNAFSVPLATQQSRPLRPPEWLRESPNSSVVGRLICWLRLSILFASLLCAVLFLCSSFVQPAYFLGAGARHAVPAQCGSHFLAFRGGSSFLFCFASHS